MTRLRKATIVAASLLLVGGLSACNANPRPGDTAANTTTQGPAQKGGTMYQLLTSKEVHWDPAKSQNLGISGIHLIVRGLTSWQTDPSADTKVVDDLATDTGTTEDGGKTWKFTLKDGLTYSDGTPIKAPDIKFGVERSFDTQLSGGLSYHKALLEGAEKYQGPKDGQHLDSIECPDDKTILFKLNKPFADWPWVVSMPAFAPIPADKGMGIPAYDHTPPSSGPYQVASYNVGSEITLVRNEHWDPKTDPARSAGPDKIHYKLGLNADTVAQRLVDDKGEDQTATGVRVTTAIIPKINADPAVKARVTMSSSGAAHYLAMNTSRPGLRDLKVRQAISYVINKQQVQTVAGGPQYAGALASTIIPPGIQGHHTFNLYDGGEAGDPQQAKELLGSTEVPELKFVVSDYASTEATEATAIVEDLKKLGLKVNLIQMDSETHTKTITESTDWDLTISSWQADYPGAYAMVQPLFDSSQIGNGNFNLTQFNDPEIDKAIVAATAETDEAKAAKLWGDIDKKILEQAPIVPLFYSHNAYLNGSKTTGTYIPSFPAYPNILIQGLK